MDFASSKMRKCTNADYKRTHMSDCNTVDYLTKMTEIRRKHTSTSTKPKTTFKIESSKDIPYATYFENFIVNNM
jgi:hypothetical protein